MPVIKISKSAAQGAAEVEAKQVHTTKIPDKHSKKSGLHYKEFTWPDGGKYEGEWLDGRMHGKGTYVEADGSRYEGQWREGKMHGKGTQIFAKGDRYEGEYHDGYRHGKGKQSFANGNLYVGNFWQGQIHGIGTYTCADGRVYSGEFKNNKKHGRGKYSGANGSYDGQYLDSKKHGHGKFTWTDGSSYDGEWADDVMHGTGVRTALDGTRSQVSYERGRLVNSISTLSTQKKGPPAGTKKAAVAAARPGSAKGRAPPKPEAPAPDHGFLMDGKTAARDMYDEEEEEDTGPLGNLRRNWNELNEALNCYGAVTEARDACAPRRMRGKPLDRTCDPNLW